MDRLYPAYERRDGTTMAEAGSNAISTKMTCVHLLFCYGSFEVFHSGRWLPTQAVHFGFLEPQSWRTQTLKSMQAQFTLRFSGT